MRWLLVLAILVAIIGFLRFAGGESDPRAGYASVQRIILAQLIGSERSFITGWDQSAESVTVSGTTGYVSGWYTTRISTGRLPYQMTVSYDANSDTYRSRCFVLLAEIDGGAQPCF